MQRCRFFKSSFDKLKFHVIITSDNILMNIAAESLLLLIIRQKINIFCIICINIHIIYVF